MLRSNVLSSWSQSNLFSSLSLVKAVEKKQHVKFIVHSERDYLLSDVDAGVEMLRFISAEPE